MALTNTQRIEKLEGQVQDLDTRVKKLESVASIPAPPASAIPVKSGLQAALDQAAPGKVLLLQYDHDGPIKVSRPGVSVVCSPDQRYRIKGRLWVAADDTVFRCINLDGWNADLNSSPTVSGAYLAAGPVYRALFEYCDLTNGHHNIGFGMGHQAYGRAVNAALRFCRIHGIGVLPPANHDHGIYAEACDSLDIYGCVIFDCADRGIQFYPDAQGSHVQSTIIDRCGEGVIYSDYSAYNVVERSLLTNSQVRFNAEGYSSSAAIPIPQGNRLTNSLVWNGKRDDWSNGGVAVHPNFTFDQLIHEDPLYKDPANGDYTPQNPKALALLDPKTPFLPFQ